jgi:translocation and assembly module TamB
VLDLATLLPSTAQLQFDWRVDESAYTGRLDARTTRGVTALSVDLTSPIVVKASGGTQTRDPWTTWNGKLELPEQVVSGVPAPWGDAPVALSLEGAGTRKEVLLSGRIGAIGRAWTLERATLVRTAGGYRLGDSRLAEVDGPGTLTLSGDVPGDSSRPMALVATFDQFALPLPGTAAATRLAGTLAVGGTSGLMELVPDLMLSLPDLPQARVTGRAHVTPAIIGASPLELQFGEGALAVVGPIPRGAQTDGAVAVVARAFDPAVLLSSWPGRLDGAIAFRGKGLLDGAPEGTLQVQTLRGTLRGYPVSADGAIGLAGGGVSTVALEARSGSASLRAEGRADQEAGLALSFDAPDLSSLVPDATGALTATARVPGPLPLTGSDGGRPAAWQLPVDVDATASGLAVGGYAIGAATLAFDAGDDAESRVLAIDAQTVAAPGVAFDQLSLRADGTAAAHTLALGTRRGAMSLDLGAEGGWADERWTGTLDSLHLIQVDVADANLRAPAAIALGNDALEIGELCLDSAQGNGCVRVAGAEGAGSATLQLRNLPIALADAVVALPEDVDLEGYVEGDGELRWSADGTSEGTLSLRSARGVWVQPDLPELDFGYEDLVLDGHWSGGVAQATLEAKLLPDGTLRASTVPDGADGAGGRRTEIALAMPRLDWLEEFVPQIDNVQGNVEANLVLRNRPDAPRIDGLVRVGGFATDLPTLGIRVYDGDFVMVQREGGLDVAGTVRSGDGRVALTGRLDREAKNPVDLRLRGNDVLLVDRGDARVVAAPDLTLVRDAKRIVRLGGSVEIPGARIDLSRLEAGAERSADVVITDAPATADAGERMDWRAKVTTVVGPDVRLTGFGLSGKVAGSVTVSQRRGRVATGTGELMVEGRYAALGQAFELDRGRLLFSGGPLDNPSLLLTAEQRAGDNVTRVRITGTARRPELHVSSSLAATESEAIQNLLGRSGTFSFGRYLSPKLYVGYGIGLISGGEVFTVRYNINRSVELEANSGAENNASINYRIER